MSEPLSRAAIEQRIDGLTQAGWTWSSFECRQMSRSALTYLARAEAEKQRADEAEQALETHPRVVALKHSLEIGRRWRAEQQARAEAAEAERDNMAAAFDALLAAAGWAVPAGAEMVPYSDSLRDALRRHFAVVADLAVAEGCIKRLVEGCETDLEDEHWIVRQWVENYNLNAGGEWHDRREPMLPGEAECMRKVME